MTTALKALADVQAFLPEVRWVHGDDLCDCAFQRIGEWTNPYIGRTLRVRLCCIWKEIYAQYPQFVEEVPAYWDDNAGAFLPVTMDWDVADSAMPRALWYRQLAARTGKPLEEIRREYANKQPPGPVVGGRKSGEWIESKTRRVP